MTTRHLVDPELLPLIDLAPADAITSANLAATRAAIEERFAGLPRPAVVPTRHLVPGRDGAPDVSVFVYDPPGTNGLRPAFLHIHGGGMIAGKAALTTLGTAPIALGLGCVVVSVDYRLAPETQFPGPQEDCYAALEWLLANADALRIDPTRVAVSGDSAGGGLAAALSLMARDRSGPVIIAQLLTYPMLDHRTGGLDDPYRNAKAGEFIWTGERNQFGWQAMCGDYGYNDRRKGWFSPMLAESLADLPPTWIGTGSLDLFFDEILCFTLRLSAAGVAVDLNSYAGAIHGFNACVDADVSKRFAAEFACTVTRLLRINA